MRSNGFTLIELLIVLSIIGILTAVLIPNLLGARNRAQDAAAKLCSKEILTQAEIYHIDTSTYPAKAQLAGDYEPAGCKSVLTWAVTTNTGTDFAGTATSKSLSVFNFSNSIGVVKQ